MSSAAQAWLERTRWANRTERFGELGVAHGDDDLAIVTMELDAPTEGALPFWDAWARLPAHPGLLRPLGAYVLRYAAIDWRPSRLDPGYHQARIARYGLELCDLFETIIRRVGEWDSTWFIQPIAKLDVQDGLRIAFTPPARDDRRSDLAFVRAVGLALEQLIGVATEAVPIGRLVRRCLDVWRVDALQSLAEIRSALSKLDPAPASPGSSAQFAAIEQSIGAYWSRDLALAQAWIERAVGIAPSPLARDLLAFIASKRGPDAGSRVVQNGSAVAISMIGIDPLATSTGPEVPVPRLFQNQHDLQNPPRVVRPIEPARPPSSPDEEIVELLRRRRYGDALVGVDGLLAEAPEDPRAHHLRGKALLALGRLPDARAAFDRACTLQPRLLEAMLLRREVDRVMSVTRESAGLANPMVSSLPERLAELRDVLVSGRVVDAIQMLKRPTYDDDVVAQLLLADLLIRDDRNDDALTVLAPLSADEAFELRARALAASGRDEEAEVEMSTYMRLIEQRSDRRVGSR
ncbi:MAG TPA: tetratricopeptide repeat protein [Kofleriaceae bacterium]